ncbi:MAG TPA: DUF971 domain-containing protein [Acidimicrobiia bacterium]|nr:DUF971 domain-containing protein [Acidimicrobiia bacterium]
MPLPIPDGPAPSEVELDRTVGLTLRWPGGETATFALPGLRAACPCAECRGRREQGHQVGPGPDQPPIEARGAELVGAWGLTIEWSDGHGTGIYSWGVLRAWAGLDAAEPTDAS